MHDLPSPHLGFDIPRCILHDYDEKTLNQRSINAAGPSKEHIEAQPIGGRTDQYATQKNTMSPPRLLILYTEYTHVIRAVCAGEYRDPVVVLETNDARATRKSRTFGTDA